MVESRVRRETGAEKSAMLRAIMQGAEEGERR
jgi:hypothetical protein